MGLISKLPDSELLKKGWPWTEEINAGIYSGDVCWPRISIITPSFNQGQYIEETILSVINQNYPNLEYIIIDGGSTDGSVEIIKKYEKHLKYWISEPDKGQSHAINKGLEKCTGDIFNWLNSDDFLVQNALELISKNYLEHKADVIIGNLNIVNSSSAITDYIKGTDFCLSRAKNIGLFNPLTQPSVFFNYEKLKKVLPLNEKLHYTMDLEMWLKYQLLYDKIKYLKIDKPIVNFRIHKNSKSSLYIEKPVTCEDANLLIDINSIFYELARKCNLHKTAEIIKKITNGKVTNGYNLKFDITDKKTVKQSLNYYCLKYAKFYYNDTTNIILANRLLKTIKVNDFDENSQMEFNQMYIKSFFPIIVNIFRNIKNIKRNISNKIKSFFFFFKPRKVVAQYKLFFGDEWLGTSVDSIAPYVYKILFVVSDIAWGDDANNPKIKGDDLELILSKIKNKYPDKVIIIKGSWNQQLLHVQAGLDYIKSNIKKATHCLYIDGDEIYTKNQITKLLTHINKIKYFNCAIRINYNTYFKTIFYKIYPNKYPLHLVLFPLRKWVKYREARNVNAKIVEFPDLFYEHPAYVRASDEKIRLKIDAHRETEAIIGDWYRDVWLKWTPEMKNFHPTSPEFWEGVKEVKPEDLPEGVEQVYSKWK